jgi:hypothetical protein
VLINITARYTLKKGEKGNKREGKKRNVKGRREIGINPIWN